MLFPIQYILHPIFAHGLRHRQIYNWGAQERIENKSIWIRRMKNGDWQVMVKLVIGMLV